MDTERSSFAQQGHLAPDGTGPILLTGWKNPEPADHRGLPSCNVGIVLSFSDDVSVTFEASGITSRSSAFVAGMHISPVCIHETGLSHGVQIKLSPASVRRYFGVAAGELTHSIFEFEAIAGRRGRELAEALSGLDTWEYRFAVVREFLHGTPHHPALRPELDVAWRRLVAPRPDSVKAVAERVGWSRRHLYSEFCREFGVSPSTAKRVARFERARGALDRSSSLADSALHAGYFDQAHMTREWSRLAGCTPARWLAEQFPSVQES